MSAALVQLEGVTKAFPVGDGVYTALRGIDLTIARGEFVSITGPSGHGKSTLMSIIGGLDRPTTGRYLLDGTDVAALDDDALAHVRSRMIGFVFQNFNLIPTLTALENVELPMVYAHVPAVERRRRALALMEWVGIADHAAHRPMQLSGGQQQRVAICRALSLDPPLILADEPTGNLDSEAGGQVLTQLVQLHREGRTLVIVTHDPAVADAALREVHIWDGRIAWDRPRSPDDARATAPPDGQRPGDAAVLARGEGAHA